MLKLGVLKGDLDALEDVDPKWVKEFADKLGKMAEVAIITGAGLQNMVAGFQGVDMALKLGEGVQNKTGVDYGQHLKTAPITAKTSTEKSVKGEKIAQSTEKSEVIHKGVFTDGMSITVGGGRTLNLGNYESARVDVSITVPCDKESLDETYTFATEWVSTKIAEALEISKS